VKSWLAKWAEFNDIARKLYESLGYIEFARIPDFTWWNGELRTDIRLEKYLLSE
jgi:RimJ/RimL family protein N-acetyltransferase